MTEHDHDLAVEMYGECPTCAVEAMAEATGRPSPLARNSDPWSSHVAAARIEPTRGTRKALVLALLRGRAGEWEDQPDRQPEVTLTNGGWRTVYVDRIGTRKALAAQAGAR